MRKTIGHLLRSMFTFGVALTWILSVALPVFGQTPKTSEPNGTQVPGDTKKAQARAVFAEAMKLVNQGTAESMRAALPKFDESRRLHREIGDNEFEAFCLGWSGLIYSALGEKQKALDCYNQALPLIRANKDLNGEAETLNKIGAIYAVAGDKRKALDYYNQALPLRKAAGDKSGEAYTLTSIGLTLSSLGENQKALDYFNQALPLSKAVSDKKGEATTLNNIGVINNNLGEKQKALDCYHQALPLIRAVGDKRLEAITLSNIGGIYSDLGEKQKALAHYNQALLLRSGDKQGEATTLNNVALVYSDLGEKQKALDYYDRALLLFKGAGDKRGEATTVYNIGLVYSELGEKQKALDYYNQALPLRKEAGDKAGEAYTLTGIGLAYSDLGDKQKALGYYNQALPLFNDVGDRRGQATTFNNIALVYSDLGERQKAVDYYNRALPLDRAIGNKRGEAYTLSNIGVAYSLLGENQKALEYFNRALPLGKANGDRRTEATALSNIMWVWKSLNNQSLAILYGKQSVNVFQSLRADLKGIDKDVQQSFLGAVDGTYRLLAELSIRENRIAEAEQVLRMLKEEEYFEFVRRDGRVVAALDERINLNSAETQAVERYESLSLEIGRIDQEIQKLEKEKASASPGQNKNISERLADLNRSLTVSISTLESFLVELSKDFGKKETDSKSVEASSQTIAREWNDPRTAIISTIVGRDNLSVIVTTSAFQRGYVLPVPEEKLNKLVGNFRTAILERSNPQPAAQELYNVLVKPLEKDLESIKARTLIWSLDKFLRYVPMSALWDKDRGYLVQTYASVVLALASRQNLAFRPAGKNQWQALGVGVSKQAEGFGPLSYVPKELQAIIRDSTAQPKKQELGIIAGRRLLDEQFTYESFLRSLRDYRVTHAATHFKFIPGTKAEGLNSFLLMGNGERLTLAQVQNSDNIFAGIELLTLSACDTGYGGKTADGREIEGFGVLAQRKGARAIMATLWPVDDESTRDLMIEFYGDYQKPNFTKAEALRQAQLALLQEPDKAANAKTTKSVKASPKRFAHPYYWSPFILIGNWQ